MKNYKFSIVFVTLYLVVFTIAGKTGAGLKLMLPLFILSPILIIWMVYSILKYGNHSGQKLSKNEEWGYEDKRKNSL